MAIPIPHGMNILDWTDEIVYRYGRYGVPRLATPDDWREWSDRVLQLGPFQAAPRHDFFESWEAWGYSLMNAVP